MKSWFAVAASYSAVSSMSPLQIGGALNG
jgi:hypothetical protein